MIKKYYWAMAVMAAFVAGTILSGSTAEAKPGDEEGEGLIDAVLLLAEILDNLEQIAGPQGEQGEQGEQGPAGTIKTYFIEENSELNVDEFNTSILCDDGDVPLGGGVSHTRNFAVQVRSDNPFIAENSDVTTGWRVFVESEDGSTFSAGGWVICLDNAPFRG